MDKVNVREEMIVLFLTRIRCENTKSIKMICDLGYTKRKNKTDLYQYGFQTEKGSGA